MSWALDRHVRLVAALHIVLGGLFGLGLAALVALGLLAAEQQGGLTLPAGITGAMVATPMAALAALHLFAGFGFLQHRRWARALIFVLSFIALLNIPLGTAVGGYSLWVLQRTTGW